MRQGTYLATIGAAALIFIITIGVIVMKKLSKKDLTVRIIKNDSKAWRMIFLKNDSVSADICVEHCVGQNGVYKVVAGGLVTEPGDKYPELVVLQQGKKTLKYVKYNGERYFFVPDDKDLIRELFKEKNVIPCTAVTKSIGRKTSALKQIKEPGSNKKSVLKDKRDKFEKKLDEYNSVLKSIHDSEQDVSPYDKLFVTVMDIILPFAGCRSTEDFPALEITLRYRGDKLRLALQNGKNIFPDDPERFPELSLTASGFTPYSGTPAEDIDGLNIQLRELEEKLERTEALLKRLKKQEANKLILKKIWPIVCEIYLLEDYNAESCSSIGGRLFRAIDGTEAAGATFHLADYQPCFAQKVKMGYNPGASYPALFRSDGDNPWKDPFDQSGRPVEGWDITPLFNGGFSK